MQNLYEVKPSADGLSYTFTTKYNVVYNLVLTAYPVGEASILSLSLYPDTQPLQTDYGVRNTVIDVIGRILSKDSNVIFYICDNMDDRENTRHKVFDYWYLKVAKEYLYINKYDYCVRSDNGYQINSSILYNVNNPLSGYIINEFKKLLEIS